MILIVEDENNLGLTLKEFLDAKGFTSVWARDCMSARKLFNDSINVVLMDIGLPDGNGIELAQELRSQRQNFILLFLSAQNDPETKYNGLKMGAEDYVTKPFDIRELLLRLEKAQATHQKLSAHKKEIQLGSLSILFEQYQVIDAKGEVIDLAQKECAILQLLFANLNKAVSRDDIIERIWGEDAFPSNRTVDNYIVKLRKWIETDDSGRLAIKTVRGVGYQLIYNKE